MKQVVCLFALGTSFAFAAVPVWAQPGAARAVGDEPQPPSFDQVSPPPTAPLPSTSLPPAASTPLPPPADGAQSAPLAPPPVPRGAGPHEDDTELLSLSPGAEPSFERPLVRPDFLVPSLTGPIGLYRMSTADVGPENHLRLGLHGEYFKADDFLVSDDENSRLQGGLTFGFTPHPNVEIFGALLTSSNRNRRSAEPGRRDPEMMKSFGDLVVGPKVQYRVDRATHVGFEAGFKFLSSISELSFSASSTSVWFGPLLTTDLRKLLNDEVPVRLHANASYFVDNSSNLHDFTDVSLFTKEVAMFAYGIGRSRLRAAVGVEGIFDTLEIPLQLFAEYHAEIVTADADPDFAPFRSPDCVLLGAVCKDNRDQHWVTLGARAQVWRALTLHAGTDLRIRSVGFPYGTPLPPYNVVFGVTVPLDVDALLRPVVVARPVESSIPPAPIDGHVVGVVTSGQGGAPIAGAIVAVIGRPRSRVATDPDGTFATPPLPLGVAELEVTAPDFEPAKLTASVVGGAPTQVAVLLTPRVVTGSVRGRVTDDGGRGVEALLTFAGADRVETRSDATGLFVAALSPGPYQVKAVAPGFPEKRAQIDVNASREHQLDFLLRNRPANPNATLENEVVILRAPIKFGPGTPRLDATAQAGLDGVAEILEDHPEIKTLRVEAHWGAGASLAEKQAAKELTDRQAGVVRDYLLKKGVSATRIEAVGAGAEKPIVPNIGPVNQAKNRRVELLTVK